ncbi:CheR family methyltransferase [Sporolactobacillus vineae]|uniref:CheR family methyltransferase n=1 Tax=Sporolactobacillus vineae TaxID=444463 RepID=UPI000288E5E7|nr:protein-glutamate O-methyltransferase CheR [Sporolactobacillus vineae]
MESDRNQDYEQFKERFFRLTGINLSLYKEEQMKRRLNSFRARKQFPDLVALADGMEQSGELLDQVLSRMTINVTEFFRNASRWQILEDKIKGIAARKENLTVWSAACSTGEEPYSLSMLIGKYFSGNHYRIVATDIDREVLRQAEAGIYQQQAVSGFSAEEQQQFFTIKGPFYRIRPELKRSVRFLRHDLLRDPAPGRFDVIVCRNVLIYFTEEGKSLIYQKFGHALNQGGILFVGSTEQIFRPDIFGLASAESFFYRKQDKKQSE